MYQACLWIKQTNLRQTLKYGTSYAFDVDDCEILWYIKHFDEQLSINYVVSKGGKAKINFDKSKKPNQ